MKIRQKLALLVAVPLIAVLVFAALAVVTTGGEAIQAERLRNLVAGNAAVGELVYQLQAERSDAVRALVDPKAEGVMDDFMNQATSTDKAIKKYRKVSVDLTGAPSGTDDILDRIDIELSRLDALRDQVSEGKKAASSTAFAYRITIADLLSYRERVPQASGTPSNVADNIRASTVLARATEYLSIENVAVLRAIDRGELSASGLHEITAASTGRTDAALTFESLAPRDWSTWLEQSQSGSEVGVVESLEDEALRTLPGDELAIDADKWTAAMSWSAEQYQDVQSRIDNQIVSDVTALRDSQFRWTAAQIAGVIVAVVIALVLAMRLGGPVVRGLRRLRDSAHKVATEDLPRAVAQLEDANILGEQTPEEFAKTVTPPVKVRGKDELADVGQAFNEVHQEAIRVAAHQALLRLHIGAMFVRLARRGHSLSGRLTAVLDEAERNEQDPDRLERLFALDHLVTLFGRTNDSLLVLGGASPAKARAANETAANVLTAAQSQIEQYQQVQIGSVDEGVSVKAAVVDDVVKLLAELLDNATRYSAQPVRVTSKLLADRMVIQVFDRGIGIPPERIEKLNARLATRSPIDLEAFQAMGLTVVGHLAALHGIQVELRQATNGGTLAEVSLPSELLDEHRDPRALPAGYDTKEGRSGRAPLFSRGRRRRQTAEKNAPQETRPTRQPRGGSRPQMVPESNLPATRSTADPRVGMPILRFDWRTAGADPGYDASHTAVQPAVDSGQPRARMMSFGGHRAVDAGWKAADRASSAAREALTNDGLPRRDPMAQLVPGAVEASSQSRSSQPLPRYRDPATVGATYAAYVRSRAGNRPQPPTN